MKAATLKRTNWTTEEVIHLVDGMKLCTADGSEPPDVKAHNAACDMVIDSFRDYLIPETEFGAMAFCPDNQTTYHIGPRLPR